MSDIKQLFKAYQKIISLDEPMSKHTYFGVGGPAQVFVSPNDIEQIKEIYLLCQENKIPIFILGNGTNLLISDKGVNGVVIKPALNGISMNGSNIEVETGYALSHLVLNAINEGLSGLEGLIGIPGSIGGAVIMNAGGKYGNIGNCVSSVMGLNRFGEETIVDKSRITFGYRTSSLHDKILILSVNIKLTKGNPTELKSRFQEILKEKSLTQPLAEKSAGCVFKNPPQNHAGALIEKAGLKGYTIGGAKVSEKHANFIVNTGNATAKNIIDLMNYIRETIKSKFGVTLESEIEIW